jgi:hypothetical protein
MTSMQTDAAARQGLCARGPHGYPPLPISRGGPMETHQKQRAAALAALTVAAACCLPRRRLPPFRAATG